MSKLLITGALPVSEKDITELENLGFSVIYFKDEGDIEGLRTHSLSEVEYIVCNRLFDNALFSAFPSLKCLQLTSSGVDHISVTALKEKGVILHTAKGVYSVPIAEWTVAKILEVFKKSREYNKLQKEKSFKKINEIEELYGKTALIIGLGSVGKEIAKRLTSFSVRIIAIDNSNSSLAEKTYPLSSIKEALSVSDIVILSLPLSDATYHLLNSETLSYFKKDATLINVARGKLIDENALIDALKSGKIGSAILDVFENEPLSENSPLWEMENVIISPHSSFKSINNAARLKKLVFNNLKEELKKTKEK